MLALAPLSALDGLAALLTAVLVLDALAVVAPTLAALALAALLTAVLVLDALAVVAPTLAALALAALLMAVLVLAGPRPAASAMASMAAPALAAGAPAQARAMVLAAWALVAALQPLVPVGLVPLVQLAALMLVQPRAPEIQDQVTNSSNLSSFADAPNKLSKLPNSGVPSVPGILRAKQSLSLYFAWSPQKKKNALSNRAGSQIQATGVAGFALCTGGASRLEDLAACGMFDDMDDYNCLIFIGRMSKLE